MRSRMSGVTAEYLFPAWHESGPSEERLEHAASCRRAGADVLGVEPDGFRIKGVSSVKLITALARLTPSRVKRR